MKLGRNFMCAITLDPSNFSLKLQFYSIYCFQWLFAASMPCADGASMAVVIFMFCDGTSCVYKHF